MGGAKPPPPPAEGREARAPARAWRERAAPRREAAGWAAAGREGPGWPGLAAGLRLPQGGASASSRPGGLASVRQSPAVTPRRAAGAPGLRPRAAG